MMGLYFYSIEYFMEKGIGNSCGSMQIEPNIKNYEQINKAMITIVKGIEEQQNIEIGTNYKILCFNKI